MECPSRHQPSRRERGSYLGITRLIKALNRWHQSLNKVGVARQSGSTWKEEHRQERDNVDTVLGLSQQLHYHNFSKLSSCSLSNIQLPSTGWLSSHSCQLNRCMEVCGQYRYGDGHICFSVCKKGSINEPLHLAHDSESEPSTYELLDKLWPRPVHCSEI